MLPEKNIPMLVWSWTHGCRLIVIRRFCEKVKAVWYPLVCIIEGFILINDCQDFRIYALIEFFPSLYAIMFAKYCSCFLGHAIGNEILAVVFLLSENLHSL